MFYERKLDNWLTKVRSQVTLPLRIELWNGKSIDLCKDYPSVTVRLPHVSSIPYLLTPSLSNLGTAYVEGKIDVDGKALEILKVVNALAAGTLKPVGKYARIVRTFLHNKEKDAAAIRYHYDVSNDFYRLWLDENMVYSCAYFENGDEDLNTAQLKKIDHILTKIRIRPGDKLLDIGCGWGALAIRAAQKFGAKCVGITLSENQYALAKERVERAGLCDRVEIRLQDYRDVKGSFDRITSVGMFEHVGLKYLPTYFSKVNSLLTPDGIVMNHGITSTAPNNGEVPYGGGDFIQKYVFPNGELVHISEVLKTMQEGGLEALDIENLRHHYARTLTKWAENFESNAGTIRQTTDDKHFRIWRVYLAGCAHAFTQDWVSIYQVVCSKAGRQSSAVPLSRRYMYQ
ncbi:MAG: class I SAM-dependent methyltransferase [Burkholderiaceae bacterium]